MSSAFTNVWDYLFDAASFMPHGVCLAWRPDLVAMHVAADAGIVLAYGTIPIALLIFVNRRKDLKYKRVFALFAMFILACGLTHAFGILTLWQPLYGLQGMIKVVTAAVSLATAIVIWPILPRALALPSPAQLRAANEELIAENAERQRAEADLREAKVELERRVLSRTNELRVSEARFRDFAGVSADWFWEMDRDGRFTYVSRSARTDPSITPDRLIGRTLVQCGARLSESAEADFKECWAEKSGIDSLSCTMTRDDGGEIYVSISAKPIEDEFGEFAGYRGTGRDVTNIVRAEQIVIAERDRARRASEAKTSFLANMSHELRTPLNGIAGYAELLTSELGDSFSPEKKTEITGDIFKASQHLVSLINNVLDLNRIEAGSEEAFVEDVLVAGVLQSGIDIVQGVASRKSIKLAFPDAGSQLRARVDPKHLSQIAINLLSNAVKYTDAGGNVAISIDHNGAGEVRLAIKDTGVGIAADEIEQIFEVFARAKDITIAKEGGTGLGLPLVKRLVELNNGRIELQSKPGQGTTVAVILPESVPSAGE